MQECLEGALSRLLGRPVAVTGAGRTDSGVHAFSYIAHFDLEDSLPFEASDITYKLNAILPREIAVHGVWPVADDLHARFSAKRREYTYFINREKDPFVRNFSWYCGYPGLDFQAMNDACHYLLGTHDFTCFEKSGSDNKTSVCTVFAASWQPYIPSHLQIMGAETDEGVDLQTHGHPRPCKRGGPAAKGCGRGRSEAEAVCESIPSAVDNYWYFRIAADRFLRNMVRAIVGTLIEVGRGKHRPEWIAGLIESGTRSDAGESVPGHALFLNKVDY